MCRPDDFPPFEDDDVLGTCEICGEDVREDDQDPGAPDDVTAHLECARSQGLA